MDLIKEAVCKPIVSLEDLKECLLNPPDWPTLVKPRAKRSKVVKNCDLYCNGNICHIPKDEATPPLRYEYGFLPKTLVCHDMMNGYKDDSHIFGTDNFAAYTFYNWSAIDMFVYFSHHFITVPPLGWINAAHKHGVQILGTIITEWEKGSKICEQFLQSEEAMESFVKDLVAVAKHFHFDGWLINIENEIKNVDMLLKFVKCLADTMHSEVRDSVVIWYDSVTIQGELSWQNCLNNFNRNYFDACDGIFTNYSWTEKQLEISALEAGLRRTDVYVGVDIWGRNFWGGGCLNTVEAIKVIHKHRLSLAIFAPAWTHEGIKFKEVMDQQSFVEKDDRDNSCASKSLTEFNADTNKTSTSIYFTRCAVQDHFLLRETALWNTIWPYLNTRGPSQLPFQTFFCMGSGKKKYLDGKVIDDHLWFNLNDQEHQISIPYCSNSYLLRRIEKKDDTKPKATTAVTNLMTKLKDSASDIATNSVGQEESKISADREEKSNDPAQKSKKPPVVEYKVKPNLSDMKCILPQLSDSYKGGSCLKILPISANSDASSTCSNIVRLFLCEFLCDYNFIVYCIIKSENDEQDLNLHISLRDNKNGKCFQILLCGPDLKDYPQDMRVVKAFNNLDVEKFKNLQTCLSTIHPQFVIPTSNEENWKIRYFVLEYHNSTMLEINCSLTNNNGHILLGGLGVASDIPLEI